MQKRTVAAFVFIIGILGLLILRIYDISGSRFSEAADNQSRLKVNVANIRGTIYDSELRPLVNADTEYRVSVTSSPAAMDALSKCVSSSVFEQLSLRLQVGKPVVTKVDTLPSPTQGLSLFKTPVRYTEPLLAPHVIGYLDGSNLHGVTGAELVYDDILSKASGALTVTYTVNAVGKTLDGIAPEINDTLDIAKTGIALTINKDIQAIAEKVAKEYLKKGAVVVMEPTTGRISAMVSLPDFQLSNLKDSLNNPNSPMINRALANYNCGSVFKIVTTIAALEAGINPTVSFTCNGSFTIGENTFHCHNRLGHGRLAMADAFTASCNPYYIQLSQLLGSQKLYATASALGFERSIILDEGWKSARAVLPSEDELQSPSALANVSFGQGALMATPVHFAQLVASVVNEGYIVRPTLFLGKVDEKGTLTEQQPAPAQAAYSALTAKIMKSMMIHVVEDGTGKSGRPSEGGAGGKTGTAETGWKVGENTVIQGWFAGFYPAESPKYVIVVLAEDTQGTGGKAAPVFKKICEELAMYEKVSVNK